MVETYSPCWPWHPNHCNNWKKMMSGTYTKLCPYFTFVCMHSSQRNPRLLKNITREDWYTMVLTVFGAQRGGGVLPQDPCLGVVEGEESGIHFLFYMPRFSKVFGYRKEWCLTELACPLPTWLLPNGYWSLYWCVKKICVGCGRWSYALEPESPGSQPQDPVRIGWEP